MATLVGSFTGNFTASSWLTVDNTGSGGTASLLDSEAANTALTTSYVLSSAFQVAAGNYKGIAIKLASRAAGSPTNTLTVALDQASVTVSGTETTMNVSDIDPCSATGTSPAVDTIEGGWYYFVFNVAGTPTAVTLSAATNYTIKAKLSATTTAVNLFRDATAGNWSRMIVSTTAAAPASADILHFMGDNLAAGTRNSYTLTMDNTASTTFGAVANTLGAFTVGKGGTVTWGTSGSTNYLLTIAGPLILYSGATWNQGTSGTRIPSTSTAKLLFAISTNVDGGFIARKGSTVNRYGNIVTATSTLLNTDEAAASTVIGVASTSGWAANDEIAFAPTSRTYTEFEKRTIQTVDSGTQVTITSGLTNAHSGTSPLQGTVVHLTRNVKVCGTSTSLQAYVLYGSTAVVNDSYCQFYNLGSGTGNKRGIDVLTTTGSYTAIGCTLHDNQVASSLGWISTAAAAANISITYCSTYNVIGNTFTVAGTSSSSWTLDNCIAIGGGASGFNITDIGGTLTNCLAAGCGTYGFSIGEASTLITGTISNLTAHTNNSGGITINAAIWGGTISNLTLWRNATNGGMYVASAAVNMVFDTITAFGNTTNNINYAAAAQTTIKSLTASGDTSFATTNGVGATTVFGSHVLDSCNLGTVTGIKTAHTNDINPSLFPGTIICRNCILASATEVLMTSAPPGAVVVSEKHDQTAGLHKRWERYGTAVIDTTTYRTASPAETLTPSSATVKFASSPKQFAIANGATATPTVYVNKAAAYNGAQPRLIVRANSAIGITSDTVLATASGGTGSWLTLSGTTGTVTDDGVLEIYVDCDGTAGTVSIDDWSVTGATDPAGGEKFWYDGRPSIILNPASAGSGGIMAPTMNFGGEGVFCG